METSKNNRCEHCVICMESNMEREVLECTKCHIGFHQYCHNQWDPNFIPEPEYPTGAVLMCKFCKPNVSFRIMLLFTLVILFQTYLSIVFLRKIKKTAILYI